MGQVAYMKKYCAERYAANRERFKAEQKAYVARKFAADPIKFRRARFEYYTLNRAHGIDRKTYDEMLIERVGCCDHCRNQADLHLDHCHETNRLRGMLCLKCNTALGQLGDTEEAIERLLAYVRGGINGE